MKRRGFFKTALGIGSVALMPQEKEPEVLKKDDLVKQDAQINITGFSGYYVSSNYLLTYTNADTKRFVRKM